MKKIIFGFIFLIFGFLFYVGFFPIASVNGDWIWYRDVTKGVRAIERLQTTSSDIDLPALAGTSTLAIFNREKIRRGVLEELIREELVKQELEKFDPSQDWNRAVEREIEALLQGRNIATLTQAARELYGLSFNDFQNLVLAPQIRDDFLRKELARRDEDLAAWLERARDEAEVKIYFFDYERP